MKALVVDGYNAIHKIPELRVLIDKSLAEARKALTGLAMDYQRKVGGIAEVYVVFDGNDAYGDLSSPSPAHQVFSKTGEGDEEVIRLVRKLSNRYHVIVASDDNFVRNNSRAHNASIIAISELLAALKKKTTRAEHDIPDEKRIDPKDAKEITEYLKKRLKD